MASAMRPSTMSHNGDIQDDNSYLTVIAIAFSIAITIVAISLRLLARGIHRIPLGLDDYFMFLGALFTISHSLLLSFVKRYGNGRHIYLLQPHDISNYARVFYISEQLYGLSVTAIKLSILLFYRRLFPTAQFRTWTTIVGICVVAWLITNNVAAALQCIPVQKAWKYDLPGRCANPLSFVVGIQVPNVILDVMILVLPMPMVYRLQLSRTKRLRLAAIFLLGGLSVIIAIVRLAVLASEIRIQDFTYPTAKCSWTVIEPAMGVLAACLPTMAPLLNIRTTLAELYSIITLRFSFRKVSEALIADKNELEVVHDTDRQYRQDWKPVA